MAATRALLEREINWPCQIKRLYSTANQGSRFGVSRAIDWFFSEVEEGIILEDDCVPHPDFFKFSSILLDRYRHDTRVWCISGNNFQDGQWRGDGSYYFSRIPLIWGWATWRRCWQHYDDNLKLWPALRDSGLLETIFEDPLERSYWSGIWQRLKDEGKPEAWDYRWSLTCVANSGLTVEPNRNLVSNVGFGPGGTHTTSIAPLTKADQGLGELIHPSFVIRDERACRYTFDTHFGGAGWRESLKLIPRIRNRLRYELRHLTKRQ